VAFAAPDASGRQIASNVYEYTQGGTALKFSTWFRDSKTKKWLWIGLGVIAALQIYFVRELLVALMLFTGLFVVCAVLALALYLVDRGSRWGLDVAGTQAKRALNAAEEISKKQLRRPRSETAQ
jgi:uncharacterized membrane protein (UPF0136 family)